MSFEKISFGDDKLALELSRKDIELEQKNNEIVRLFNLLSKRDEEIVKLKEEIDMTQFNLRKELEFYRQEENKKILEIENIIEKGNNSFLWWF
jgi:hypothetical protein